MRVGTAEERIVSPRLLPSLREIRLGILTVLIDLTGGNRKGDVRRPTSLRIETDRRFSRRDR
jgi:hypothetical protein